MKKWWRVEDIKPCVSLCEGCGRQTDIGTCVAYISPEVKWSAGWCNHNNIPQHIIEEKVKLQKQTGKKRINPLKWAKRGGRERPYIHRGRHYVTSNHKIGGNSSGRNNRGYYRATF